MIVWSDTQPGRLYPLMDREGNYVAIVTSPELNPKHDLYYQYCLETEDRYIAYVLNKKIYRNDIRLYYKKKPVAIKNYFDPPKITLAEASRMTNIPINTLRGQCQRGEIPDVQQLGDQRIYLKSEIGRRSIVRLVNGDDPETVLKEANAEWAAESTRLMWND
jgi:hypothetical protein